MSVVLAANNWASNAELIEDVAQLGYLKRDDRVLDPTYGRGTWWKNWSPRNLVTHDIKIDGVDFRQLPYGDGEFDAVAYDPPYVSVGGRSTTGMPDFQSRYGMTDAPSSPREVQMLINTGLIEVRRVTRHDGIILVKCQDYISSGHLWAGTHYTLEFALGLSLDLLDRFEHVGRSRPQPDRTRKCSACGGGDDVCSQCGGTGRVMSEQQHARRNLSTLFVFKR